MKHETVMIPRRTDTVAFPDAQTSSPRRQRSVVALALAALVALLGVLARPSPPALSTTVTGDAALAARARPLLHGALDRVSIAVVDGSTTTYAGFGANEYTQYEIRSLTKPFTAVLLADAIRRMVRAVLRWPELAWFSGPHPLRRALGIGATLVSCALIIGVAVT